MTPTYFLFFVLAAGLLASGGRVLYFQMIFCLFGAAAAIQMPALGGSPISPAVCFLPILVSRAVGEAGIRGLLQQIAYPKPGFWLVFMVIWCVLSAYFLPRLFTGDVLVRTLDRGDVEQAVKLIPLRPVSGNVNQTCYVIASLGAFVAVSAMLNSAPARLQKFCDAVLILAGLNCLAGLLDLGQFHLGLPDILNFTRNGGYANLDQELDGLKRIAGTFAETSAFSAFTLPLCAFTFCLWLYRVRSPYSGWLTLILLALLLLTTSTTAYVGLAGYGALVSLGLAARALVHGSLPRHDELSLVIVLALVVSCMIILWKPDLAARLVDFMDTTVLNKMESNSGRERGSWNAQAWSNFLDSDGLGIGLGSARASSFVVVLLSNIGLLGLGLFSAFLVQAVAGVGSPVTTEAVIVRASRQAVLATLFVASLSGGVFDLGLAFYCFAAAASMRPQPATHTRVAYAGYA